MLRARVQTQIGSKISSIKIAGVLVLLGLRLHGRRLLRDRHLALLLGHVELHFCAGAGSFPNIFSELEIRNHSDSHNLLLIVHSATATFNGSVPNNRQACRATTRQFYCNFYKPYEEVEPVMPHI